MQKLSLAVAGPSAASAPEPQALDLSLDLPRLDPRTTRLPEPIRMARWRQEADVRLEAALTAFDDQLVRGHSAQRAARVAVEEVMSWVRVSLEDFVTDGGAALVGAHLRRTEARRWDREADRAVANAERDPDELERFLRLFVGMSHEVSARGFASLVAV